MARSDESEDPLNALLNLEEQYYQVGHTQGVADGTKAGLIEGRTFGLEKGFEKYSTMGRLAGQCDVWTARLPSKSRITSGDVPTRAAPAMAKLPANTRLQRHIDTLAALVDAETLSHQNTEDAVAEFDDRYKTARGKARIIANIVGESHLASNVSSTAGSDGSTTRDQSNIEDFIAPKSVVST